MPTNKFKRNGSKGKQQQTSTNGMGLGLVNVNPVIDRQIDGIYDLDVVDVQRYSFEEGTLAFGQPLLNAVRSHPVLDPSVNSKEPRAPEEMKNASSVTF